MHVFSKIVTAIAAAAVASIAATLVPLPVSAHPTIEANRSIFYILALSIVAQVGAVVLERQPVQRSVSVHRIDDAGSAVSPWGRLLRLTPNPPFPHNARSAPPPLRL